MEMKFYIRTKADIKKQAETYASVFEGEVKKKSFFKTEDGTSKVSYANVKLFDVVTIMISKHRDPMPKTGFTGDIILTVDYNEDLYNKIYENLKNNEHFKMDYDKTEYHWGTEVFKFYDEWGIGWILEIDRR
ncbi:MAG: hypothetical protein NC236_01985 [Mycoplasma sp.]|nr:hypothetical protein [Mycoplasma sp.]